MQKPTFIAFAAFSLALAAPFAPVSAQAPPPPPSMHGGYGGPMGGPMHGGYGGGGRMQRMSDELGLTDAQKSKLMPIFMASRPQMEAIRNDPKLTPAARMAKMQAIRKHMDMQMMSILTPAQRVKWKTMMQARAASHPGGGFGQPGVGQPGGGFGGPRP